MRRRNGRDRRERRERFVRLDHLCRAGRRRRAPWRKVTESSSRSPSRAPPQVVPPVRRLPPSAGRIRARRSRSCTEPPTASTRARRSPNSCRCSSNFHESHVSAPRTYKTRAIVLRARNLGEADKIFTLLTDARGKLDAVAKGVRRAKSHVAGRLEFASEAFLTMHRGRNLDVIVSADIVRSRFASVVDPGAFATAHMLVELVDAFCEPDLARARDLRAARRRAERASLDARSGIARAALRAAPA